MIVLRLRTVFLFLLLVSAGLLLVPGGTVRDWQLAFFSQVHSLDAVLARHPHMSPTLERTRAPRDAVLLLDDAYRRLAELEAENVRLQAEAFRLRKSRADIAELGEYLPHLRFCPARVTGRTSLEASGALILGRGSDDGIRVGDAVLQGQSVAGQVVDVMPRAARVNLITSPRTMVPARLSQSRAECFVRGTEDGGCEIVFLGTRPNTVLNELVVTSGLLGFFPPDVLIGELAAEPVPSRDQRTFIAPCRPRAMLGTLEEVLVVRRQGGGAFPETWQQPRERRP